MASGLRPPKDSLGAEGNPPGSDSNALIDAFVQGARESKYAGSQLEGQDPDDNDVLLLTSFVLNIQKRHLNEERGNRKRLEILEEKVILLSEQNEALKRQNKAAKRATKDATKAIEKLNAKVEEVNKVLEMRLDKQVAILRQVFELVTADSFQPHRSTGIASGEGESLGTAPASTPAAEEVHEIMEEEELTDDDGCGGLRPAGRLSDGLASDGLAVDEQGQDDAAIAECEDETNETTQVNDGRAVSDEVEIENEPSEEEDDDASPVRTSPPRSIGRKAPTLRRPGAKGSRARKIVLPPLPIISEREEASSKNKKRARESANDEENHSIAAETAPAPKRAKKNRPIKAPKRLEQLEKSPIEVEFADGTLRHYIFHPHSETVREAWQEWHFGLHGQPAIIELECRYGAKWRNHDYGRSWFRQRRLVPELISRTVQEEGMSVDAAIAHWQAHERTQTNGVKCLTSWALGVQTQARKNEKEEEEAAARAPRESGTGSSEPDARSVKYGGTKGVTKKVTKKAAIKVAKTPTIKAVKRGTAKPVRAPLKKRADKKGKVKKLVSDGDGDASDEETEGDSDDDSEEEAKTTSTTRKREQAHPSAVRKPLKRAAKTKATRKGMSSHYQESDEASD